MSLATFKLNLCFLFELGSFRFWISILVLLSIAVIKTYSSLLFLGDSSAVTLLSRCTMRPTRCPDPRRLEGLTSWESSRCRSCFEIRGLSFSHEDTRHEPFENEGWWLSFWEQSGRAFEEAMFLLEFILKGFDKRLKIPGVECVALFFRIIKI